MRKWEVKAKVDVITYAFKSREDAWSFHQDCFEHRLTTSRPSRDRAAWEVRVLIPSDSARVRADRLAKGADVVLYQFEAAPASALMGDYK